MVQPLPPTLLNKLQDLADRARELERKTLDPGLVKDSGRSRKVFQELSRLRRILEMRDRALDLFREIRETEDCLGDGEDPVLAQLARDELPALEAKFQKAQEDLLDQLLTGDEYGERNAILEIRAGTGGDEAALFARDLAEVYKRFCERMAWKFKPISVTENDLGGFKEAVFSVEGTDVFRYLRFEMGGHRVQRIPVTETQGRIHTSAATVAVLPEAEELDVRIEERDLEIQTTTSSGPGGQHVNKTESAVRITHLPTGTVVFCQEERSQHKNKAKAMRLIRARVLDLERKKAEAERAAERRSQVGSGDRSMRIRTYNWPQNRVTDHRTRTSYSLTSVVEGDLEKIFEDLMRFEREQRLKDL